MYLYVDIYSPSLCVCACWAVVGPVYYIWLWHHYCRPTRRLSAHLPLRCVCHLSFRLFSAVRQEICSRDLLQRSAPAGPRREKKNNSLTHTHTYNAVVHFASADSSQEGRKGRGRAPPREAEMRGGCPKRKPYPFKSKWDIAVREKERRGRRKRN